MHEAPQMDHRAIFPQPDAAVEEADYRKMYLTLFNQVTRAIDELDNPKPHTGPNHPHDRPTGNRRNLHHRRRVTQTPPSGKR